MMLWGGIDETGPHDPLGQFRFEFVVDSDLISLEPWSEVVVAATAAVNRERRKINVSLWHSWWLAMGWKVTEQDGRRVAETQVMTKFGRWPIGRVILVWPKPDDREAA